MLGGIADSAELRYVQAEARGEAARLRYALRTGGRVPRGLDRALAEIAETASVQGMRVELVTAELGTVPGTRATTALEAAIARALDAARELGGAGRAVVRAVSADAAVTVTVRDHGCGFQPGTGSDYESRLLTIRDVLLPCGGKITIWSEPGNGVRVTLDISAGDGGADDAPDGLPDSRVRQRPAGDHQDAVGDGDVDAGLDGGDVAGAQHEVGVAGFQEIDVGSPRNAFQAGPATAATWRLPAPTPFCSSGQPPTAAPIQGGQNYPI